MSELKNGFLTAEKVMDILQVKQSKAYQIIRQLNKELSGMGLITVPGRVDANYFKKGYFMKKNRRSEDGCISGGGQRYMESGVPVH